MALATIRPHHFGLRRASRADVLSVLGRSHAIDVVEASAAMSVPLRPPVPSAQALDTPKARGTEVIARGGARSDPADWTPTPAGG